MTRRGVPLSHFQAFESFVRRCPKEVSPHIDSIIKICLKYLCYDPNYNYEDDEVDDAMDLDDEEEEHESECERGRGRRLLDRWTHTRMDRYPDRDSHSKGRHPDRFTLKKTHAAI